MKRALLALLVLATAAAAAEAQVVITYTKKNKNSSFSFTFSGGGYSYGGSGGYSNGFGPGFVYSGSNGTLTLGTNFLGQDWRGLPYGYWAYGTDAYYYGRPYGYGYGAYGAVPTYLDYTPVMRRVSPVFGAPREFEQLASQKEVAQGIAKFKAGDYAGALAEFKAAVTTDFSNGPAQLWMGLALAGTGDFKNAEKAVSSAFASGVTAEQLNGLEIAFKDAKERVRYAAAVEKAGGRVAGLVFERLGDKEKAKAALDAVLKAAPGDAAAEALRKRIS